MMHPAGEEGGDVAGTLGYGYDLYDWARVDKAHESLNGHATQEILQREFQAFGRTEYESLATKASEDAPIRPANLAICEWIRFIKEIATESKCISHQCRG